MILPQTLVRFSEKKLDNSATNPIAKAILINRTLLVKYAMINMNKTILNGTSWIDLLFILLILK